MLPLAFGVILVALAIAFALLDLPQWARLWQGGPARPAIAVVLLAGGRSLVRGRTADRAAVDDGVLFALSLTSQAFLAAIITAGDKARLLAVGLVAVLVVGLVISFLEEIGWTGLATRELRKQHGLLATGLILGLPWGVMHLPAYAASGAVPPALEVAGLFFYFVPYRMLMVWVYDRTQSVLIAILMHLPPIVFLFNLLVPAMAAVPELIFNFVFGATLWVFVAAVAVADRRKLSRAEHTRATPPTHVV